MWNLGLDNPTAWILLSVYVAVVAVAGWVRSWTESGFWQAVHTGRTFMLQASTLAVGLGFSYLDQTRRAGILRPFLPPELPKDAAEALIPPWIRILSTPELIFLAAVIFVVLYIMTGFYEHDYLRTVGNPPRPRKYTNPVNEEPTAGYKCFIVVCLTLGILCLLVAFYFLGLGKYIWRVALFAYALAGLVLLVGSWLSRWRRGTEAKTQKWDVDRLGGEPK